MESSNGEWERWYRQEEPETAELPSEWESKCNELQRLLLVLAANRMQVRNAAWPIASKAKMDVRVCRSRWIARDLAT
eukprot:scaffold197099_cov23-Tisochrysis_lutea.AAC.1